MTKTQIVETGIAPDTWDDTQLPTDVHVVTYMKDGKLQFDAVRAYTMVDIFDDYYDMLKGNGHVVSIKSGFGRIKPKLYGKINTEDD